MNEGTAQFHEQLMDVVNDPSEQIVKANGIQSVLHNLENVTTSMSYAAMQTGNSEEWARKRETIKAVRKGIVVVKPTKEAEVTKRKSCETSRSGKERRSSSKERKSRICTVYYSKSNSDARTKRCRTIFHLCIC